MLFFFSLYLQVGRGMSVQQAGFFLALQSVVQALTTPLAARLCNAWNPGYVCAVGVALCGLGLTAAGFLQLDSPLSLMLGAQCLLGVGISLFALPNTTIILESAGPEHVGQASGLTGAPGIAVYAGRALAAGGPIRRRRTCLERGISWMARARHCDSERKK